MTKKKKVKKTPLKGERKLNLPVKKVKNAPEYFLCMGNNCHGQNITQVAKECKNNALTINAKLSAQKTKAVRIIKEGYEQLGKGLTEFIKAH